VLASLRAAGWNECELFGLTWASPEERKVPVMLVHNGPRAAQVRAFLDDVRAYTHSARVDLVGHSMGVTVGLHALEGEGQPAGLRRFVGIAGALRGLFSCLEAGPAMYWLATCWTQSPTDPDLFGFYPDGNLRMSHVGFRAVPTLLAAADFSVVYAGHRDQLLNPSFDSALFLPAPNVRAQLDVGAGAPIVAYGPDGLDDSEGVGHFRVRSDSGPLLVKLLSTDCRGSGCCAGFAEGCVESPHESP
jgi:pimeloyl-ACP methyl ester carboxylesterase